jgi:hypothetical protein
MRSTMFAILMCSLLFIDNAVGADLRLAQAEKEGTTAATAPVAPHPILVELFTSEGCSSCPPADALLQNLDASQPVPGAKLIVLSEHVDYWDHDGWKDANSSVLLTERQEGYVRALGLKSAYTPQFIVDGTSEVRANNAPQVKEVFQKAADEFKTPVSIREVTVDLANVLRLRIEANGEAATRNADVYVALALDRVESQVVRGENSGKRLTHTAVVQQLTKVGKLMKGRSFDELIQLKLKPGTDLKNLRIIAFVQESGPGKVLGSALRMPGS